LPDPRGSTGQRGYGAVHAALRKRWAAKVARGEVFCSRCGGFIDPDGPCPKCGKPDCGWHLGHDDEDRTKYNGPEHACCNIRAARRSTRKTPRIWRSNRW